MNTPKGPLKISAKSTTKEVKILMPDGSEVDAKVAAKDPDLDLAFIRPEKPADVKLTAINTADSAKLSLLEEVIVLGRLGKELNRECRRWFKTRFLAGAKLDRFQREMAKNRGPC